MRKKRDEGEVECVAENAHGDPVSAKASLKIFDGDETFASNSTDDNWKSASLVLSSGLNIFFSADVV